MIPVAEGRELETLSEETVHPDPVEQFRLWYDAGLRGPLPLPNAMTLATATPEGRPSARVVLLKGFDAAGFVFFTNYDSRKGRELAANPSAALVFYWPYLDRQVRVEGRCVRVGDAESDDYFRTRPRGSQLSAWASPQSDVVADRSALERVAAEVARRYADGAIPRPPNWGGFRLVPEEFEFWLNRPDRLHDRLRYRRAGHATWRVDRLAP